MLRMADRVLTYVDGESHYRRSEEAWQELHGTHAKLSELRYRDTQLPNLVLCESRARIFWTRRLSPGQRTTYFTSVVGDHKQLHETEKILRGFGVEPYVILEPKNKFKSREELLGKQRLIEKPKGVDAAIIVQVMLDAQRDWFDICHLYTSDIDFAPVIRAVKQFFGKRVIVHGYANGLGGLEFVELADCMVELNRNEPNTRQTENLIWSYVSVDEMEDLAKRLMSVYLNRGARFSNI